MCTSNKTGITMVMWPFGCTCIDIHAIFPLTFRKFHLKYYKQENNVHLPYGLSSSAPRECLDTVLEWRGKLIIKECMKPLNTLFMGKVGANAISND